MQSELGGLAEGLNGAITQYLGAAQQSSQEQYKTQRDFALKQYEQQEETKRQLNVKAGEQSMEGQVTPDMAESLIPGSSKWVTMFQQQNKRYPTVQEAKSGLLDVAEKLKTKEEKSNIRHYMGNDSEGNAIFSDNEGNMFGPDKKPFEGKVLPKSSNQPTSSTRSSAEFATTILPHIEEMRGLIDEADKKGFIGPASGRIYNQFLAGKIGSTGNDEADRLLGRLRSMDSLLKTGAMRVHFGARGGQQMYEHFSDMLNSGKQSKANLYGSLDTLEGFMQGYANAGKVGGNSNNQPAPSNERITVISPDGKKGTIPASQLQEALKSGYKQQ